MQAVAPFEHRQLDQKCTCNDLAAKAVHQFHRGASSPTSRQQVVDDQHTTRNTECVAVDLQRVVAVLQRILCRKGQGGQLARFAYDGQPRLQCVRDGGANDEAARLDAQNLIDTPAVGLGEPIHDGMKGRAISQQRGDVFEDDAGLREIGNVADVLFEIRTRLLRPMIGASTKSKG